MDGDPAGMRDLAAQLRAEADRLGSLSDSVNGVAANTDFVGPAADRFRDDVGGSQQTLAVHAAELLDLAAALEASASEVEAAQAAAAAAAAAQAAAAQAAVTGVAA